MRPLLSILTAVVLGIPLDNALAAIPANDDFENATLLTQDTVSDVVNNSGATTEPGESSSSGENSVWWTYRPSASGRLTITTAGSGAFLKGLAVYLGTTLADLRLVARDGPGSSPSIHNFPVTANTDYKIRVGSFFINNGGTVVLGLSLDSQSDISYFDIPFPATTANDRFAGRILLVGQTAGAVAYNLSATTEAAASEPSNAGFNTMWWTYRPSKSGRLTITTTGSDSFSKNISVYLGTNLATLRLVTRIQTGSLFGSDFIGNLPVTANTDYQISVGSVSENLTGSIVLAFSFRQDPGISGLNLPTRATAANDMFANRVVLTGSTVSAIGYNPGAGREPLEPPDPTTYERTIWWSWTAPAAGRVELDCAGSDSITKFVTVWRGASLASLQQVGASTASQSPRLVFTATAGETYQIAVGNRSTGSGGSIVMTINGAPGALGTDLPDLMIDRAVHFRWFAMNGINYQVQQSPDNETWTNMGDRIVGDGTFKDFFELFEQSKAFYRVHLEP